MINARLINKTLINSGDASGGSIPEDPSNLLCSSILSKSGMPPTRISSSITFICMLEDSSSELSGRFNIYRKGKPAIVFNAYGVRRIGGRIVILKDEYI